MNFPHALLKTKCMHMDACGVVFKVSYDRLTKTERPY
jgi:hypothetical protein